MDNEILWAASEERKQNSTLWQFCLQTQALHGRDPENYAELLDWSIKEPEAFYASLWDFLDIIGYKGPTAYKTGATLPEVQFFPEAQLNYTQNLLRDADDRPAIIAYTDEGDCRRITRRALQERVSQIAQALRAEGIVPGDRVAAIVTNDLEAVEVYLATIAIGAIWASCSPDFGPSGAQDRLCQIDPKILFAVSGYAYAGKQIDIADSINTVASHTSVQRIILLNHAAKPQDYTRDALSVEDWLSPFAPGDIDYHMSAFNAPMVILFSSGTTGKPKCIVHSAGGLLMQHKKEQALHCDVRSGDKLFYFTTCGWMMWNWQVSALSLGATLVTYDGNPFYPTPDRLLDLIDAEGIAVFGTSAKYIDACNKAGLKPRASHGLRTLKTILSTGSPLLPESFDYIYRDWKTDVHLASISGGTDICACFVGGVPILPVRRGELQGAMLGMDVDILDADGRSIADAPGDLVCRNAHPSMPVAFWHDEKGEKYHDAYFEQFDNIWAQGDFAEKKSTGGFLIYGRSDTTLNPGGVRIGTAEIYRQVESIPEVLEAVAVGQDWGGDQRVILFVVMRPDVAFTPTLDSLIRVKIRTGATPRHVPAHIVVAPDIPKTRSGKISEITVRDAIHGRATKNTSVLSNAECLEFYRQWMR